MKTLGGRTSIRLSALPMTPAKSLPDLNIANTVLPARPKRSVRVSLTRAGETAWSRYDQDSSPGWKKLSG
jgi:hypothetical protein